MPKPIQYRSIITCTIVVVLIGAVIIRFFGSSKPVRLVDSFGQPYWISQHDDSWYFVDRPSKGRERLVRASKAGSETLVTADKIAGYDVNAGAVAWTVLEGGRWSVYAGPLSGPRSQVWSGTLKAGRPVVVGSRIIWAATKQGLLSDISPISTLGPSTDIMMSENGQIKQITSLPEPVCNLLAIIGDNAYGVVTRAAYSDTRVIYSISISTGKVTRLVGGDLMKSPVVTADGTLYWEGKSQDSANNRSDACVFMRSPDGKVVTLADWLPMEGVLFPTESGLFCANDYPHISLWKIVSNNELVTPYILTKGFVGLAVGKNQMLVRPYEDVASTHLFVLNY